MSTISSTSSVSSVSSATANAQSQVRQAAQSIISGATGNLSMDVSTLVAALVNAKTAGQAAALKTKQTNDNTTLSAYDKSSKSAGALPGDSTLMTFPGGACLMRQANVEPECHQSCEQNKGRCDQHAINRIDVRVIE